ncbi:DnaJ-domain-containing protein [Cylindrobasidium torrendii FP15055 ss-10]|uniref:DnaJ-domain-containing protein n=1 Tax=Cylindrobasidium torrendii FP15055 ss-10 TaxID=1314674 RepID=A0A0D7BWK7_9AGAR|nr:DnaJ-domain-containing protein [Cylindrobasidium torrendii FP15055 ss-10]
MRTLFFAFLLAVLATVALAWEKEDHELFDLVEAIEASEGKGTTFYSWLNVPSTATTQEIAKAYRKLSMQLHPDKNPNDSKIHERFARLGVVSTILRKDESRKRYDFFYKNGVPKWRGTGYYYSRFRPGLGSVSVFLVLLTSGLQYIVQSMNYKRDLARIERISQDARLAAWGPKLIPIDGQRKVKVNLGGNASRDEDGNVINRGRLIDMVVDQDGTVFFVAEDGFLDPLDASSATPPSVARTWAVSTILGVYTKFTAPKPVEATEFDDSETDSSPGTPGSNGTTLGSKYAASAKAGGRRRKPTKRR